MSIFTCTPEIIALVNRMADASGAVVRKGFRSPFAVEAKDDASPVTAVDRGTEAALRQIIAAERPEDGIWGEEMGKERIDADYIWVLDPIDGTRSFTTGKPIFATLIALLHQGEPVLGVIDQPILGERWVGGIGYPTRLNGKPCQTRPCGDLSRAVANLMPHLPRDMSPETPEYMQTYLRLDQACRTTATGGDAYGYAMVASGFCDLVVERDLKLYDFAALVPVVEAAGGRMTDWQGRGLDLFSSGDVVAVGDGALLDQVLKCL